MSIPDWIQFGVLLVALATLSWQQQKSSADVALKEKRIETKLRIFYAVAEKDLDEAAIVRSLEQGQPLGQIDPVELKKSLYEMLSEETIRFTEDKKYKPRQRSSRDSRDHPPWATRRDRCSCRATRPHCFACATSTATPLSS